MRASVDVRSARIFGIHSTHPPFGDEIPAKFLILQAYTDAYYKPASVLHQ